MVKRFSFMISVSLSFYFIHVRTTVVHWAKVILDTATLICTIIMRAHHIQHMQHHNTPQQIQIVVRRMQISSQFAVVVAAVAVVVAAARAAVAVVDRIIVPAATDRHHTGSAIMCSVNQDSTMAAVVMR